MERRSEKVEERAEVGDSVGGDAEVAEAVSIAAGRAPNARARRLARAGQRGGKGGTEQARFS